MEQKYWIFDLFGTLIGGEGMEQVYIEALSSLFPGVKYWEVNACINAQNFGSMDACIAGALQHFSLSATTEQIENFKDKQLFWKSKVRLNDGVVGMLATLKERKNTVALITNDSNLIDDSFLERFDLVKYFDVIIQSYKVGLTKPNPEIYKLCVEKMGARDFSEVTMVGDKLDRDVEPPKALGMKGILYDPYEKNLEYPDRITSFKELV
jgi:HAD superfamily hydrolase (TIGR01549 family)